MAEIAAAEEFGSIKVIGLKEIRKSFREAADANPKMLRDASKAAADLATRESIVRAQSLGGVQAKIAPSITARAGQVNAGVSLGGANYPYAGGANFGAIHGLPRTDSGGRQLLGWNQFPEKGGSGFAGAPDMIIYWTIEHQRDAIVKAYQTALDLVMTTAFSPL